MNNNTMRHILLTFVFFVASTMVPFHLTHATTGNLIWRTYSGLGPDNFGHQGWGAFTSVVVDGASVYTGEGDVWNQVGAWASTGFVSRYSAANGSLMNSAPITGIPGGFSGVWEVEISSPGDPACPTSDGCLYAYIPGSTSTWRETLDKLTFSLISVVPDPTAPNCNASSLCSPYDYSSPSAIKRHAFSCDRSDVYAYHPGDYASLHVSIGGTDVYIDPTWTDGLETTVSTPITTDAPGYTYLGVEAIALSPSNDALYIAGTSQTNPGGSYYDYAPRLEKVSLTPPSPSVSIWAAPSQVSSGSNTMILWNGACTDSCQITSAPSVGGTPFTGTNNGGTSVGPITANTTVTATCTRNLDGASASDSVLVSLQGSSAPDLTAGVVSPITATVGTAATFSATISNIGTASTGTGFSNFFQVATVANGGGTITDLPASTMSALAASASGTATDPYTFSSAGTYSMRACADKSSSTDPGTITESNESNNCGAWTALTVAPASSSLNVSCTVTSDSPSTIAGKGDTQTPFTWTANATGGNNSYTYA
ncbi:MAG: CARDB domain-containing protein, partial [Minisyncoccota bacterium]